MGGGVKRNRSIMTMTIRGFPIDRMLTDQEVLIGVKNDIKERLLRTKIDYQAFQSAGLTAKGKQSEVVRAKMVKIKGEIDGLERTLRTIDRMFEELKKNGEGKVKEK